MLTYETIDSVAVLRIDDARANAVGYEFLDCVNEGLDRALSEHRRSVVLAGRKDIFCAGFDLSIVRDGTETQKEDLMRNGSELFLRLLEYPLPTVAACTGHAIAAGAFLLLVCDKAIGSSGKFDIGLNETKIGMEFPFSLMELAKAKIDPRKLTDSILYSTLYPPLEAMSVGYLSDVVEPENVVERAIEIASSLAKYSSDTYRANKLSLYSDAIVRIRSALNATEFSATMAGPPSTIRGSTPSTDQI